MEVTKMSCVRDRLLNYEMALVVYIAIPHRFWYVINLLIIPSTSKMIIVSSRNDNEKWNQSLLIWRHY
jgi:hypothetical protein